MAKKALIIANSQYEDERFAPLPAAAADAAASPTSWPTRLSGSSQLKRWWTSASGTLCGQLNGSFPLPS